MNQITPGQILGICANIASELNGTNVSLEQAQAALKNPACATNIVAIIKNRGNLPNLKFGPLPVVCVHKEGEGILPGAEYIARAREASKGKADQSALEFYSKHENWHLLLEKDADGNAVEVIIFADTEFTSEGGQCVRFLCRLGAGWHQSCRWIDDVFSRRLLVACPA